MIDIRRAVAADAAKICSCTVNAFKDYINHPIYKLYKNGINISINTDNMTIIIIFVAVFFLPFLSFVLLYFQTHVFEYLFWF